MLRSNGRGVRTMDVQVAAEDLLRDMLAEMRETMTAACRALRFAVTSAWGARCVAASSNHCRSCEPFSC